MLRPSVMMAACVGLFAVCLRAADGHLPPSAEYASRDKAGPNPISHDGWEAFLRDRVDDDGSVDYLGARSDARLKSYVSLLAGANLDAQGRSTSRKAFWINAYNALAIQGVLDTLPDTPNAVRQYRVIDQPIDGLEPAKGFFQGLRFTVCGRKFTLDEIEKRILLRQWEDLDERDVAKYAELAPDAGDPRVHFALVCCARGCPKLQRFAYVGQDIDAQLDAAARAFVSDASKSRFDVSARVWHVSELLNWYGGDFSKAEYSPSAHDLFKFVARYADDESVRSSLLRDTWRLKFIEYDWRLNIRE